MKTLEEVIKDRIFIKSIFIKANIIKTEPGYVIQKLNFLFKDYQNVNTRTIFKNLKSFIYYCFSCLCLNENQYIINRFGIIEYINILSIDHIFNVGFNFHSFKHGGIFKFNFLIGLYMKTLTVWML